MIKKRGQISTEYLIITGIVLVILVPLIYYAFSEYNNSITLNQAGDAVDSIQAIADHVYIMGEGSKQHTTITLPGGVENITLENNEVDLKLNILGGTSDIHRKTKANITGTIPSTKGTYTISAEALSEGVVLINQT